MEVKVQHEINFDINCFQDIIFKRIMRNFKYRMYKKGYATVKCFRIEILGKTRLLAFQCHYLCKIDVISSHDR